MQTYVSPFQKVRRSSATSEMAAGEIADENEKTDLDLLPHGFTAKTDTDLLYMRFPDDARPRRLPQLVRNKHMLSCCRQCKHLVPDPTPVVWCEQNTNSAVYDLSPYCKITRRDIPNVCSFPTWCPLREVDVHLQLTEHRF